MGNRSDPDRKSSTTLIWLVVSKCFKHEWIIFHFIYGYIWDVILPIDELMFFKMVIAPPTSNVFFVQRTASGKSPGKIQSFGPIKPHPVER